MISLILIVGGLIFPLALAIFIGAGAKHPWSSGVRAGFPRCLRRTKA